jgi:hypothetical protein
MSNSIDNFIQRMNRKLKAIREDMKRRLQAPSA